MVDPAKHYHRIETADLLPNSETGISVHQDSLYYLTRLEGQLVRLEALNQMVDKYSEIQSTIKAARAFAQSLRDSLSPGRVDVV
jgi:hypothetical protein